MAAGHAAARAAALLLGLASWAGCSVGAGSAPLRVEPGREFTLRVGQSALLADGSLQVGFDAVVTDSRCPRGERCVWAGEARVRVWTQPAAGARQAHELREGAAVPMPTRDLRFARLEPYPVSGRPTAPGEYRATLVLEPPGGIGSAPAPRPAPPAPVER